MTILNKLCGKSIFISSGVLVTHGQTSVFQDYRLWRFSIGELSSYHITTYFLEVNKETGRLSIGSHRGTLEDSAVYSGGSSEVLSKLIGAKGRCYLDQKNGKRCKTWFTDTAGSHVFDVFSTGSLYFKAII